MYRVRILQWATALLLIIPSTALAQTTGQPPTGDTKPPAESADDSDESSDEEADDESAADDGEADDEETAPMGTPEPVEPTEETSDATTKATTTPDESGDGEQQEEEEEEVTVIKKVEKTVNVDTGGKLRIGSAWNREQAQKEGRDYLWSLDVGGYIRAGYTSIQNDPDGRFGLYDGFVLGNARLTLDGRMRSLGFRFQLDGAVDRNDDANDPNAEVVTRLKDANLYWHPFAPVRLTVGQFKPPFDIEEQFSTSQILFVDRSVASRGVKNVEGRNVRGLSVQREVGVKIGNEEGYFFMAERGEKEGPGLSYAIAVTNGQDANRSLNDNDKVAGYGRAAFHWGEYVSAGGGYYFNDKTIGVEPDTIEERRAAWTADLVVDVIGITAVGSVIGESTTRPELDGIEPDATGLGYQAQLAYREPLFGFQPAFRYAYFDPTETADSTDALTHITFGLNYVPDYPVRLMLNYTLAQETAEFSIPNNRFDGVLQVTW